MRLGADGGVYCDLCGLPPTSPRRPEPNLDDLDWELSGVRPFRAFLADRGVRLTAFAILAVTAAFPIAACLSQL